MKTVKRFPKFTDEEKRKFYEQVAHSSKISKNKKKYVRSQKRKGDYNYE